MYLAAKCQPVLYTWYRSLYQSFSVYRIHSSDMVSVPEWSVSFSKNHRMLGESGSDTAELDISLDVRRLTPPDSRVRAFVPSLAWIRLAADGDISGQLGTSAHDGA